MFSPKWLIFLFFSEYIDGRFTIRNTCQSNILCTQLTKILCHSFFLKKQTSWLMTWNQIKSIEYSRNKNVCDTLCRSNNIIYYFCWCPCNLKKIYQIAINSYLYMYVWRRGLPILDVIIQLWTQMNSHEIWTANKLCIYFP